MTVFFDLVRVYCTTLGSAGPLALGGAVTFSGGAKAFRSFADAGIPDGAALSWAIEDLSLPGREAGTGTYSASAGTVTRNTTSSTNANSPLNLSGQAQLFVTALAADLANAGNFSTGTVPVTCGGTGAGGFTAHGVLLGEGASAFGVATTGTAGQLLIDQGGGTDPSFTAMSGDAIIAKTGVITVAKTNGVTFAASATTDATNATNVTSGSLPLARFGSISASLFLSGPTTGSANPTWRQISTADLPTISGDVSIPGGTGTATVNKVNGVSYGAAPSTNTVPVVTGTNAVTYETCPVAAGGTGVATLSAHGVLIGEGTAAVNVAATGTAGQLLIDQGSGNDPSFNAMSGDATITRGGALTVTKTNGVAFAASATTDATNASNIVSGTLPLARFGSIGASLFLGGPTSGSANPTWRLISTADLPTISGDASIPGGTGIATVNKVNGVSYGATPSTGTIPIVTAANTVSYEAVSGDATLAASGALTVTKTNGATFAASATTDTTNAANISGGTLPSGRLSGSYAGITGLGSLTGNLTLGGNATGIAFGGIGIAGLFGIGETSLVAANGVVALTLSSGLVFFRDQTNGGWALGAFDGGSGATIIAGTSNFVLSDPGASASKWWIKSSGNIENRYASAGSISYVLLATSGGALV